MPFLSLHLAHTHTPPPVLPPTPRNYAHLPVTSVELPVDPGGHYSSFPHFVGFAERIRFVGGINKPKIVAVADSEGGTHRQLVRIGCASGRPVLAARTCVQRWAGCGRHASGAEHHACAHPTHSVYRTCTLPLHRRPTPHTPTRQVKSGNDDLRQDAVMQQFFWLVNRLLGEGAATARRALFIRTYKASWLGLGGEIRHRRRQCSAAAPGVQCSAVLPVRCKCCRPAPPRPTPMPTGGALLALCGPAGVGGAHPACGRLPAGAQPHGRRARALQAAGRPLLGGLLSGGALCGRERAGAGVPDAQRACGFTARGAALLVHTNHPAPPPRPAPTSVAAPHSWPRCRRAAGRPATPPCAPRLTACARASRQRCTTSSWSPSGTRVRCIDGHWVLITPSIGFECVGAA